MLDHCRVLIPGILLDVLVERDIRWRKVFCLLTLSPPTVVAEVKIQEKSQISFFLILQNK